MAHSIVQALRNVGRATQIVNVFAKHGFKKEIQQTELKDLINISNEVALSDGDSSSSTWPKRLVGAFEELGPTFVKLGQILAAREDIFPEEFILELRRLQDAVKPFSYKVLIATLKEELGCKYEESIESVDEIPIGAASIGQVHVATLKSGEKVVLKVQRPNIRKNIRSDLSILKALASVLQGTISELKALRPIIIIEELEKSLENELDFLREGSNTVRAHKFFQESEKIYVPKVFKELSTENVICLEYIHGIKITKLEQVKAPEDILFRGVSAFLDMVFKMGVFHADLHPGNFILMDNGKLAIIDFGLTSRIPKKAKETLLFMFLALKEEKMEIFSKLFCELTDYDEDTNLHSLELEVLDTLDTAFSQSVEDLQLGRMFIKMAGITARYNAPVSRELILFFRGLVALESFGRTIKPDFDITNVTSTYGKELPQLDFKKLMYDDEAIFMMRDLYSVAADLPAIAKIISQRAKKGNIQLNLKSTDLITLAKEVDIASNRISLAIVVAGIVLGSSVLTYGKTGSLFDYLANLGLIGFGMALILGIAIVISILRSLRFK